MQIPHHTLHSLGLGEKGVLRESACLWNGKASSSLLVTAGVGIRLKHLALFELSPNQLTQGWLLHYF